jgi:hypothetical protein
MANRISLKLTDKNDWLVEAIERARIEQNRPSVNNMVETILVSYFLKVEEKKNKNVFTESDLKDECSNCN